LHRALMARLTKVESGETRDRSLQDTGEKCSCPAPQKEDFASAYNANIADQRSGGSLVNVVSITSVAELQPVNCTDEVTEFESDVFVYFLGNPDSRLPEIIPAAEREALELALADTYNSVNTLNADIYDPFFRVVVEADLVSTKATFSRRRKLQRGAPRYLYRFRVRGRCRGCSRNPKLFDDISKWRTLLTFHLEPVP